MMEELKPLHEQFNAEVANHATNGMLDPTFRKKKLIAWCIRAALSIVIYLLFWKFSWIRWTLWVTIPLSAFSLLSIVLFPKLLQKRIERTRTALKNADELLNTKEEDR